MAVGAALLRVDILPQRRVQQRTLQVVRGKSVARQQAVGIAIFDERLHGRLGRRVEAACRTEHPYHIAVLFFMAQQPGQCVIIPRESRFPAAPGAERERFGAFAARGKALRMHQNHHADRHTVCTNRDERVQTNVLQPDRQRRGVPLHFPVCDRIVDVQKIHLRFLSFFLCSADHPALYEFFLFHCFSPP